MQRSTFALLLALPLSGCAGLLGIATDYEDGTRTSATTGGTGGDATSGGGSPSGGSNGSGGSTISRKFLAVSAGDTHACGLELDGRVTCWGGFYSDVSEEEPSGSFDAIVSGYEEACVSSAGYATCFGAEDTVNQAPNVAFSDLAVGVAFACGVRNDAGIECWGREAPTPPPGAYRRVAAAKTFACAITTAGALECFGSSAPTPPSGEFDSVSLGRNHGCAIETTTHLVRCFGEDYDGQTDAPNGPFQRVSAGGETTCVLDAAGAIDCFGSDSYGQLAAPSGSFASVHTGGDFSCALDASKAITCWGTPIWGGTDVPE